MDQRYIQFTTMSVTSLGNLLEFLGKIFFYKSSLNVWWLFGQLWKPSLFKSNWWDYILGNFWKNLGYIWWHWPPEGTAKEENKLDIFVHWDIFFEMYCLPFIRCPLVVIWKARWSNECVEKIRNFWIKDIFKTSGSQNRMKKNSSKFDHNLTRVNEDNLSRKLYRF